MEIIFEICNKPNMPQDVTVDLLVIESKSRKEKKTFPKERSTYFPCKHIPGDLARLKLPTYVAPPLN